MRHHWTLAALALSLCIAACGDDETTPASNSSTSASQSSSATGGAGGSDGGAAGEGGSVGGMGGLGGAGFGGAGGGCVNSLPTVTEAPAVLSASGLYADISNKTISADVLAYEPQFKLWSDGVEKDRWAYLPECEQIDNLDEDRWIFPVGTRMWKHFRIGNQLLETRMIHRFGSGPNDFLYATYAWNAAQDEAQLILTGMNDALGTEHDIPSENDCKRCHGPAALGGGTPSRYLGFSAIQLSHQLPGATMTTLSNEGRLMVPNAAGYTVVGDATEKAALGYLHANCANCHNASPSGVLILDMDLELKTTDVDVASTATYLTAVNADVTIFPNAFCSHRIAGQDLSNSCIHFRMTERGDDMQMNNNQMPPLGSDIADMAGLQVIEAWIMTLPPPM